MKKSYETPSVEKIKFNYRDQVVAASGGDEVVETTQRVNGWGETACTIGEGFERVLNALFGDCDWL